MSQPDSDSLLIYTAAFLRAVGTGLLGVLFALYLATQGLHAGQIGSLVAVGLAGTATGTFIVSFWADRIGRKKTLLLLSGAMLWGGLGLLFFSSFAMLLVCCYVGMVNAMGRERGALFTLEQAVLPETASQKGRTQSIAWYNVALDAGLALGSLLGALAHDKALALYVGLAAASFLLYLRLSPKIELHQRASAGDLAHLKKEKVSPKSRRIITRLSLLFGFDSLAGGFLPSSLVAYWFFRRFGVGEQMLAPLFFVAHVANAFSYLGAAWLSRRIGLVKTMVFTHLPSNVCLILIPFAPSLGWAMLLYLARECLVEMDVPTRQSYVMAVVQPQERTLASGITNLARVAAWTVAPTLSGWAMRSAGLFGLPLILGGSMKIMYDLLLYRAFRHIRPPEEQT